MKLRSLLQAGLFVLLGLFTSASFAQQDISGTWQGKLQIAPGNQITIQFNLKKQADGSYAATVNSPDNESIKNTPASKVQFASNKLSLSVDALSGSYEGTWDKNTITGTWKQPGSDLPLNLKQYVKTEISQADIKRLLGSWVGKLEMPDGTKHNTVFKFEIGADKKLAVLTFSPDLTPQPYPATDITLIDDTLEFSVPSAMGKYSASFKKDKMEGNWSVGNLKFPLNMSKGDYTPPPKVVKLPDETKRLLNGEWVGSLKTPQAAVTVVLRFSSNANAFRGALAIPVTGPTEFSISEMVQTDKTLLFKIPVMNLEYSAELKKDGSIDTIDGTWKEGAQSFPLIMKKGKYVPPPPPTLALSADAMRLLKGSWRGKLKNTVILRFETTAKREHVGFFDSPEQNVKGLPIKEANFTGNKLTLRIAVPGRGEVEYSGDLAGNKLTGQWKGGDTSVPLVLTRE